MENINNQIIKRLDDLEKRVDKLGTGTRPVNRKEVQEELEKQNSDDLILAIVNKVGDCAESEEIQNKVLDQKSMEAKILLCFYISFKYFKNEWLTTGNVEKITSGLGTKIAVGNVSNKIKSKLRQYLESRSVRKKGLRTPYRMNRKGVQYFESILNSKEIK
ncbi:MAG: hypothetical protein NT039_00535 [Candidatus Berkelbacteria bacterium]|nr:hypothetical protein [Candidatus Berkelbacteria bacterium]